MQALVGYLLFVVVAVCECRSQTADSPSSGASDLSSLAAEEARKGVYVFYTQSFIDKENKRASYRGSIYGAIQKFELEGCELRIEAVVVDKFAGTVGKRPTGDLQDTYRYSAALTLTPDIAGNLALIESRPAQLGRSTHSECEGASSCRLPWLQIQSKRKVIMETSTVGDSPGFHGQVDNFVVPISSVEVGKRMIQALRGIADSHCH